MQFDEIITETNENIPINDMKQRSDELIQIYKMN